MVRERLSDKIAELRVIHKLVQKIFHCDLSCWNTLRCPVLGSFILLCGLLNCINIASVLQKLAPGVGCTKLFRGSENFRAYATACEWKFSGHGKVSCNRPQLKHKQTANLSVP